MAEKRIIQTVAQLCSIPTEGVSAKLEGESSVENFCSDEACQTLYVQCSGDAGDLTLAVSNSLPESKGDDGIGVQFVKMKEEDLTEENFSQLVMVTSTSGSSSSLQSLYQTLKNLYAPVILKSQEWTDKLDRNTQTGITDLETQLGQVMHRGGVQPNLEDIHSPAALSTVQTLLDEISVWNALQAAPNLSECAGRFYDAFAPLVPSFQQINSLRLAEVYDLLDPIVGALHAVWTAKLSSSEVYPQDRMANTFNVIGETLNRYLYHRLDKVNPWTGPFSEIRAILKEATNLCVDFGKQLKSLTSSKEWTHGRHKWEGKPFNLKCLNPIRSRLRDVLLCRSVWEEVHRTLSPADLAEFADFDPFVAFAHMHPFQSNIAVRGQWKDALETFEIKIKAPVSKVNKILRPALSGVKDIQKSVQYVLKVRNVLRRKDVQQDLAAERAKFVSAFASHASALNSRFDAIPKAPDSGTLRAISRPLAAGLKVAADALLCTSCLSNLFGDVEKMDEVCDDLQEVVRKVKSEHGEVVKQWVADMEAALAGDAAWQLQGKVVVLAISGGGVFTCTTSSLCSAFLREVRFLVDNGFDVGEKVAAAAKDAQDFADKAVAMSKVTNLYNLTLRQALPTQRPMLLASIEKLRHIILGADNASGRREMKWKSPQAFQDFADRVRKAVEQLSLENRKLRKLHSEVGQRIVRLMNIPLLKDRETWKAEWKALEDLVSTATKSYQKERLTKWRLHWDHQMFKALQSAYQMGLESLDENSTSIECDLVFAQRQLQFRPPLEELRQHYYKEMRKFIGVPNSFNGFGNHSLYRRMSAMNGPALRQVYRKADYLFQVRCAVFCFVRRV